MISKGVMGGWRFVLDRRDSACRILEGEHLEKWTFERLIRRWEGNIDMNLGEIGPENGRWIK
jgi:hypothetical protein